MYICVSVCVCVCVCVCLLYMNVTHICTPSPSMKNGEKREMQCSVETARERDAWIDHIMTAARRAEGGVE